MHGFNRVWGGHSITAERNPRQKKLRIVQAAPISTFAFFRLEILTKTLTAPDFRAEFRVSGVFCGSVNTRLRS